MTLQGELLRQPLGRLLLIIELIPITTSLPIVTFGKTILQPGNQTLLPIFTVQSLMENLVLYLTNHESKSSLPPPIPQLSPISIGSDGFNIVFSNIPTPLPILTFECGLLHPPLPTSTP